MSANITNNQIIINQTYSAPIPIDLANSAWEIYLISTLCGCFLCMLPPFCSQMRLSKPIPITATKRIYQILNGYLYDNNIVDLILSKYCDYETLQELMQRRQKIKQLQRNNTIRHNCETLFFYVTIYILIVSLLFAAYCGVIFVVQNDQYLNKYSIKAQFYCIVDNNGSICTVNDYFEKHITEIRDNGQYFTDTFKLSEHFYDDIFIPYLQKFQDSDLNSRFSINPKLYVTPNKQNVSDYAELYTGTPSNGYGLYIVDGYLHLDEHKISDSDFTFSEYGPEPCCSGKDGGCGSPCWCLRKAGNCAGCNDCYCKNCCCWCSCCACIKCWVVIAVIICCLLIGSFALSIYMVQFNSIHKYLSLL